MSAKGSTELCRVCGQQAIARNFCVFTCESCKVFFRRNANKIDEFKCIYQNKCEINSETRKRCRKCRIDRCFSVGMRKEFIMDSEAKKLRIDLIEENRKRKLQNNKNNTDMSVPSSTTSTTTSSTNEDLIDFSMESLPESSIDCDIVTKNFELSDESSSNDQTIEYSSDLSLESLSIMRPITDYNNNLCESEGNVLTELLNATKFMSDLIVSYENTPITSEVSTHEEALTVAAVLWDKDIRNLIKTAKSLTFFKDICSEDQYLLFKYGSAEIAFMRSILVYDYQNQCLIYPMDQNNSTRCDMEIFRQYSLEDYGLSKFCIDQLASLSDWDPVILHLMTAIFLFMPTRPHLTNRSQIRFKQQIYIHLLKRYLQLKYGSGSELKRRFTKLIELIDDYHLFQKKCVETFFKEKSSDYIVFTVSPLLKEIYCTDSKSDQNKTILS